RDRHFHPWSDTAQLDYRKPATRTAMQGVLQSIADRCDGVRCDMAMLVLTDDFAKTWPSFPVSNDADAGRSGGGNPNGESEFWTDAIAETKRAHPDFLFL